MKTSNPLRLLLAAMSIALFSACNEEADIQPVRTPQVLPDYLEQEDYTRALVYNDDRKVTKGILTSKMPNGVLLTEEFQFFYHANGKFDRAEWTTGYTHRYTYNGDLIVRTDEYINDQFVQYYEYKYDAKGRLTEILSWQNIPEEGGWIAHSKSDYIYDDHDNVLKSTLYYFNSSNQQHEVLTVFEYSDYDDKKESEGIFGGYTANPLMRFRKNNPGKLTVRNRFGNVTATDTYVYQYNEHGYATEKVTTSHFPHTGETGSYTTRYFYKEIQ